MLDLDKGFRETPSAFSQGISDHLKTLREKEEPMVKRKSFTAVLIAALIIVALTATALAVAGRAGLLTFFTAWKEDGIPQTPTELTHELAGEKPLLQTEFDDLAVTVTEAAGTGRTYYFNTTIELKPGIPGRVIDIDLITQDDVDDALSAKNGGPVYFVRSYMMHEEALADSGDWMANADGSVSSVSVIDIIEAADTAQMYCYVTYVKVEPGALPKETDAQTAFLPFQIPMKEPADTRRVQTPVSLGDIGISLDELYFKRMSDATTCFVYLRYEGGEAVDYKLPHGNQGLTLRVLSEDGTEILVPRLNCGWVSDTYFCEFTTLQTDALPSRVVLEAVDTVSGTVYASTVVELEDGRLDPTKLAHYRTNPGRMWDYRDMYFPWSNTDTIETAYLSTDGETGIPLYLDPRAPSTLVGTYYSGLKVQPNVTFDGWTSVYFGDGNAMGTQGYVKSEFVTVEPENVNPGLPVALVAGQESEHIDVRTSPDAVSTMRAMVTGQDQVIVIGEAGAGDWFQIAREEKGTFRVIGYVPRDALQLTDKRITMR